MFIKVIRRIRFWALADRIGPDIPWTHWRLHFKSTMLDLCASKFKQFDATAEFRPGAYAIFCSKISIGKRVVIRPGTMLFADDHGDITVEDDVMIGSAVHMYTTNHRFDNVSIPIIDQGHYEAEPIVLKKGCWVGACCVILPGVTVGENAVVGAGSVVTKDVPPRVLAAGNPARVIRNL